MTPFVRTLLFDAGLVDPIAFTFAPLLLALTGLLPCLRAGRDARIRIPPSRFTANDVSMTDVLSHFSKRDRGHSSRPAFLR